MYIVCAALHPHRCRTHTSAPCALFSPPIPSTWDTHAKSVSALSACPIAIILYVTPTRVAPTHSSMSLHRWLSSSHRSIRHGFPYHSLHCLLLSNSLIHTHTSAPIHTSMSLQICISIVHLAYCWLPRGALLHGFSIPYVLRYVFLIALIGIGKVLARVELSFH